jgi:hypothetical protein
MELQLSDTERDLIVHVLSHRYRELMHEVSKTSHRDFKNMLKEDEKVIEELMEKLGADVFATA